MQLNSWIQQMQVRIIQLSNLEAGRLVGPFTEKLGQKEQSYAL